MTKKISFKNTNNAGISAAPGSKRKAFVSTVMKTAIDVPDARGTYVLIAWVAQTSPKTSALGSDSESLG